MSILNKYYKRKTIKSIRKINNKLHTKFSYLFCLEEIEILNLIKQDKENASMYQQEHLKNVLGLLKKGLMEEVISTNPKGNVTDTINELYNNFVINFINEIKGIGIIKDFKYPFDYLLQLDKYKVLFKEYDYPTKMEKIKDIDSLIDTYELFKVKLKSNSTHTYKEDLLNKFMKLNYYGPLSIIEGYKKIKKTVRRYRKHTSTNPFNNIVYARRLFGFNRLVAKRDYRVAMNDYDYYSNQINVEISRLKFEKERLNNIDNRYDFYFDYFLWRMDNDLEYIYHKKLGGIRKVADLVNLYVKDGKKVSKDALVVDVDRMEVIQTETTKQKSNKGGKTNALDIKEFDLEEINRNIRKEEKIREAKVKEMERRR